MILIHIGLIVSVITLWICGFIIGYCEGQKKVLKKIHNEIVPKTNKIYEAVEHEDSKLTNLKKAEVKSFALGRMQAIEDLMPALRAPFYRLKKKDNGGDQK